MKHLNHALSVEERLNLVSFSLISVVMLCNYKARCLIFKGFGGGRESILSATTTPSSGFISAPCMVMAWGGKVLLGLGMVRIAHTLMEWQWLKGSKEKGPIKARRASKDKGPTAPALDFSYHNLPSLSLSLCLPITRGHGYYFNRFALCHLPQC
ncbi:unnamed protein product [Sphenostylis stenocarpa]|uniref:Uncharacterized protein n=1 Tax=Sphenostylis stenocarpa TaxID=92480 RepID=A0AA86SHZ7_9FABA|nr:unnamed protein product [Sphenostylis stenocarpa]